MLTLLTHPCRAPAITSPTVWNEPVTSTVPAPCCTVASASRKSGTSVHAARAGGRPRSREPAAEPRGVPPAARRRGRHGEHPAVDHPVELHQHLRPLLVAQDRDQRVQRARRTECLERRHQRPDAVRVVGDIEQPLAPPVEPARHPRGREARVRSPPRAGGRARAAPSGCRAPPRRSAAGAGPRG